MQVQCTQCGAAVDLAAGGQFVTCPYCTSALYVDRSKVVFHFVVKATLGLEDAQGKLRRWMAGNETVKDLDVHARIQQQELIYFPMWRFVAVRDSAEQEFSEPASSFSISEIKKIPLSGGDLQFFSSRDFEGMPLKEPDVLLDSAISWLQQDGIQKDQIKEINLIHIPFYLFKYQFRDTLYQAIVDATSGRVLSSVYPAKDEIPFIGIAIAAAIAYFVLGLLIANPFLKAAVFLGMAVPFGIFAYTVTQKY